MLTVRQFTFNPLQENSYIVYNSKGNAIIIDPGCYFTAEEETLSMFIDTHKLKIVQLINTHCHLDHVFGNSWVYKTFGTELFLHKNEEQVLAFAPISGEKYGLPFTNYEGPLHFLEEGNSIFLDDDELQILFTPGHSPGSISLYSKADNFVIVGDVLFSNSIGRTDLPGGNFDVLINSIRTQLFVLPNTTAVHCGHGNSTTIGVEKISNPFLQ